MRKYLSTLLTIAMLAVSLPLLSGSASAQRRATYDNGRYTQNYQYNQRNNRPYNYEEPNVYDKHRKAVNLSVGTGIGAVIGALIGGKKGALIGAGAGLAGGAIVTAKQKPRNTTRYGYYY